jgi:uncharacterized protein RhaS with RHS repeats
MYNARNRYYNQHLGTFISEDPIGFAAGDTNLYRYVDSVGKVPLETNLYRYTGNNPVNFIDPLGLKQLYVAVRISLSQYFQVYRYNFDDMCNLTEIEDMGQFNIPSTFPCIIACYFEEWEWNSGRWIAENTGQQL